MKYKWPIVLSAVWLVLGLAVGFFALWYLWETIPRRQINARARSLGGATGMVVGLGWAVIWGVWYWKAKLANKK